MYPLPDVCQFAIFPVIRKKCNSPELQAQRRWLDGVDSFNICLRAMLHEERFYWGGGGGEELLSKHRVITRTCDVAVSSLGVALIVPREQAAPSLSGTWWQRMQTGGHESERRIRIKRRCVCTQGCGGRTRAPAPTHTRAASSLPRSSAVKPPHPRFAGKQSANRPVAACPQISDGSSNRVTLLPC